MLCAAAVAGAVGLAEVHAYEMGEFGQGMLVPRVVHDGMGSTTAVGLVWSCPADTDGGTVYWTFFDANANHVTDGSFPMTQNDRYAFVWQDQAGVGLDGVEGYLVFVADSNNDGALTPADDVCLMGEAFHVYAGSNDVAFVPTFQMIFGDFNAGGGVPNLAAMGPGTITTLNSGAFVSLFPSSNLYMQYSIGGGDATQIVIWSAEPIGGPGVFYTVDIFDHEQNRKSLNIPLPQAALNVVDPATLVGLPSSFLNGFIRWSVPIGPDPDGDGNGAVSYSLIQSPAFGARQTIVNPHDGV